MLAWDHDAHDHRTLLHRVPRGAARVRDVGRGTGQLAPELADRAQHVDALDRHAGMHSVAHRAVPAITHHPWRSAVTRPAPAAAVLPGVRVRRLLLWRYLLTWQRPTGVA